MNKYQYKVQGVDYDVEIMEVEGNIAKVNVNGIPFEVEMKRPINPATVAQRPKSATPVVTPAPAPAPASAPQKQTQPKAAIGAGKKITAPLPGTITDVKVKVGDTVKQGEVIGLEGGDPDSDPNPGNSTGHHLHFEIRKSQSGDFLNPREYLFGSKEV